MSVVRLSFLVACVMVATTSPCPAQMVQSPAASANLTNRIVIHLQEGFGGDAVAVVTVDKREAYRGTPRTTWGIGLAAMVLVTNASAHPAVVFQILDRNITWSNKVDLARGSALGISVSTKGALRVLQSTNFFYD